MSQVASFHSTPSGRLSYAALALAVAAVVVWVLAGIVDDGLYTVTGALGIVAFALGAKARRDARRAGSSGRLGLAAMILGGLLGGAVLVASVVWGIAQVV